MDFLMFFYSMERNNTNFYMLIIMFYTMSWYLFLKFSPFMINYIHRLKLAFTFNSNFYRWHKNNLTSVT